jgi:hypothetical protein
MQNLRIVNVQINDSSNIDVTFTENLTMGLVTSNVAIISETTGVPDSEPLILKITGSILSITCQPLTALAAYFIKFSSTPTNPFTSVNGDAKVVEDGVQNKYLITGPLPSDNIVREYFKSYFQNNIYDLSDSNGLISKYIDSLSVSLSRALYDINQVKNENYLSFTVTDEQKTRGSGPTDRLNQECAYEITRVGRGVSTSNANLVFPIDNFPDYPITLQRQSNVEQLKPSSTDQAGHFNINSLVLNLSTSPITKVNSIVFTLLTASPSYTYDIAKYGYQIKNSRYDQEFSFDYSLLDDNQIRISDKILEDPNFSLTDIFNVQIQYESKDLGRIVNENTVTVTTVKSSFREVLPPVINIFNLQHAPITDLNGNVITMGGISFIDPNVVDSTKHPAFLYELPFRLNGLPFSPGQYSIDYATGTVYVYGVDLTNDGTGPYPPLATYNYLLTYKLEQDYVYDADLLDLVTLPNGNLRFAQGNINFNYEKVLIPGVDYVADLHQEVLTERIANNLVAANAIRVQNAPVTNVFRIYNETSGEIYTLDRWNNDKVYFRYNTPPAIKQLIGERVSFNNVINELLYINTSLVNSSLLSIIKIFLANNSIIGGTEDGIASSFNTSLTFSDTTIFSAEKWFNRQLDEATNINRLSSLGEYLVDYTHGIIYCAVTNPQNFNIGTVSYKNDSIVPQFPHLISVDDIYYQISVLDQKNKTFSYTSFGDGFIIPQTLDYSDELSLNGDLNSVYQISNGDIGTFVDSSFISGVTNQIKFVRSVFEYQDLINSTKPLNFAFSSTSNGFNIQVNPLTGQSFENVQFDGSNYYVIIDQNIPYLSTNVNYSFQITRVSDSVSLWDNSGTLVPGNPIKLILPGIGSPVVGDLVNVVFTFTIDDASRVVVDYNKGEYYIDYTYVADEIIISYEYGDNVIDFRKNKNLPTNTTYYVSYKVGALRDALLRNFGTLVNIPELSNFDVDFNRERYRDALTAALTSFIQGPTLTAIKNIGKTISHIEPEIIESVFQNWSLGSSLLNPESINTTGSFQLLPVKYDNGVLLNSSEQSINFPFNSNIRLEEGTFETWISPSWNGLDNDASLSFNIQKDGYTINPAFVFIGVGENHPEITNDVFSLTKLSDAVGTPNKNKDGVFIYYDKDISGNFLRWYVEIIDGYVSSSSSNYSFKITSNGMFYDAKSLVIPKPSNIKITTGTSTINFSIMGGSPIDEGITFISDVDHYILDAGEEKSRNRISIFKDISGYLNFRVFDKDKTPYIVSADVSGWKAGDPHHVATSWKLNTRNGRDEIHLFVDGFEVPNIIKSGQKLRPYLHEKFRTVDPEEIIGSTNGDIISSTDLQTNSGSAVVTSSIDFGAYNVFIGNTIYIDEIGFSSSGYNILSINGQSLTLSSPMPQTLSNGRFSVNRTHFTVVSDIDVSPNIAVSTINAFIVGSDINGFTDSNIVTSSSLDFSSVEVQVGYLIKIENMTLQNIYTILQVSGNSLIINDNLPIDISNTSYTIYNTNTEQEIPGVRALRPAYSVSKDINFNNVLTISDKVIMNDLILIRTLGINHRKIKRNYYVWSSGVENILMTKLPPPISLDEVDIIKVILPNTAINTSNSSVNLTVDQPSLSLTGRTLSATVAGTNVDFSTAVQVTIDGTTIGGPSNEIIIFTDYGTLDSVNQYLSVNFVNVVAQPLVLNRAACIATVKEKYSIIHAENNDGYAPIIRFSYSIGYGDTLYQSAINSVTDDNRLFSDLDINNYLVISAPSNAAGFYLITGISSDRKTLFVEPTLGGDVPIFNNGTYQILNVNAYRSGLQNGFFTFEIKNEPGTPYYLSKGFYEFEYFTYTRINLEPTRAKVFLGSDYNSQLQLHGLMDQVKIYSVMLTDTRIGESIPSNQRSITKDFNSLKALTKDSNTLMLISFNSFPFTNQADFYISPTPTKNHFYSSLVVNENFGNSLVLLDEPIVLPNEGILNTRKEGTIEFWMSPLFDTANDPHKRFYFDAFGAVVEDVVSVNNVSLKLSAPASQILSVQLKGGDPRIDYFAGGKIEIDTQNATQETSTSIGDNSVVVSHPILQVITVKIAGDPTNTDYFVNGSISTDMKTIYLGKLLPTNNVLVIVTYQSTENNNQNINTQVVRLNRRLPYHKSHITVKYVPKGLQGDRIAIFKDETGYINFAITASNKDYVIKAPTFWSRNTWHRIKASYRVNSGPSTDEMRLFLDGYQYSDVLFGTGLISGISPTVMGSVIVGDGYTILGNIKFKDSINQLFIGTQFDNQFPTFSLIDNLRISDMSRPIYAPYGEAIDVNYSSNLSTVFPVTMDLFTTYLLNSDIVSSINTDFAILKNRETGLFDFSVNIIDSLGIVSSSIKSKEALEKLIRVLKPANSRVFIQYTK